ncbi:MAG: DUF5723 family protein, partial [Balneolales bacterium]
MKKVALLIAIGILYGFDASGQMYYHEGRQICCGQDLLRGNHAALGINPAELGRPDQFMSSFGILQTGINFYSNQLSLGQLFDITLTDNEISEVLLDELTSGRRDGNFKYNANMEASWLAVSLASPKLGGLAVTVRDRVSSTSSMSNDMLGLMLLGQNSTVYQRSTHPLDLLYTGDGTTMNYSHLREAHLGYGRKVFESKLFNLYLGGSVKRLWGIGYFQSSIREGFIGGASAFSQFYNINYGSLKNPDQQFRRKLMNSSGSGYSYDIGGSLSLAAPIWLGWSIVDMGKVTWTDQVIASETSYLDFIETLNEDGLIGSSGFKDEVGNVYDAFDFRESDEFETYLNTAMRLNGSAKLIGGLSISSEMILPLHDNRDNVMNYHPATYVFGVNYRLGLPGNGSANLSSAYFFNKQYGSRVPLG